MRNVTVSTEYTITIPTHRSHWIFHGDSGWKSRVERQSASGLTRSPLASWSSFTLVERAGLMLSRRGRVPETESAEEGSSSPCAGAGAGASSAANASPPFAIGDGGGPSPFATAARIAVASSFNRVCSFAQRSQACTITSFATKYISQNTAARHENGCGSLSMTATWPTSAPARQLSYSRTPSVASSCASSCRLPVARKYTAVPSSPS